jgi:hypothetical protein
MREGATDTAFDDYSLGVDSFLGVYDFSDCLSDSITWCNEGNFKVSGG